MRAPAETAPAERWNHGTEPETADIGRQQVKRPVLALLRTGKIGQAEERAAERLYTDYALANGARNSDRIGSGGGQQGFSAAVIDAVTGYREAMSAVGMTGAALLMWFVVEEKSLTAIARENGQSVHVTCGMVVATLVRLAEHYAERDGAKPGRGGNIRSVEFSR